MTAYIVSSGSSSGGITLQSGDTLDVQSGGTATLTTVNGGGVETVETGGSAVATTVSSGGNGTVSGLDSGAVILAGGVESVFGTVSGATVFGLLDVQNGSAINDTVSSGGVFNLGSGTASGTVLIGGGELYNGASNDTSTLIGANSVEELGGGIDTFGTTTSAVIESGGEQIVSGANNHATLDTTVQSGGLQVVTAGSIASGTVVQPGGIVLLVSGGSLADATVQSGGDVVVLPGAGTFTGTVAPGGTLVSTGVVTYEIYGNPAGSATVLGATVGPETVSNRNVVEVFSGGTATGQVLDGGFEQVDGGTTIGTIVAVAGPAGLNGEVVNTGVASNTSVTGAGASLTVGSGGSAVGAFISGTGTSEIVSGTDTGATLAAGGQQIVSGLSVSATVASGGRIETAGYIGSPVGDVVSAPTVLSGGVIDDTNNLLAGGVISAGGSVFLGAVPDFQIIGSGTATNVTVDGGLLEVDAGVASGTVVSSGSLVVGPIAAASAIDSVVFSGGALTLEAGQSTGSLLSGGIEYDYSGTVSGLTAVAGGVEDIVAQYSGQDATVTGPVAGNGGGILLESDPLGQGSATLSGAVVSNGGLLVVLPGATAQGTVLAGGSVVSTGVAELTSAGLSAYVPAVGPQVLSSGARAYVLPGGTQTGAELLPGASQTVFAGGSAVNTILAGSGGFGGYQIVLSGGTAIGTVQDTGNSQAYADTIQPGGTTLSPTISGGTLTVEGNAIGATATGSGAILVESGGTATGTIVGSGGQLTAGAYEGGSGSLLSTTVLAGGVETVDYNGSARDTTVSSGGLEVVADGPAVDTTVSAGGMQVVNGGAATGTVVSSGGLLNFTAGTADATIVAGGGRFEVQASATNTVISAGGVLDLEDGTISGAVLLSGANIILSGFGGELDGTVISSGAALFVSSGYTVSNTIVESGGELIVIGGTAVGTINNGGIATSDGVAQIDAAGFGTYLGATENGGTVASGVTEYVFGSGVANGTTVEAGGTQSPLLGGTAIGTAVAAGGAVFVSSGGSESGATVGSGSLFGVFAGGTASNTDVLSGGAAGAFEDFFGSDTPGVLNSTTVESGGLAGLFGGVANNTDVKGGAGIAIIGGVTSGTVLEPGSTEGIDNQDSDGLAQGSLVNVGSAVGTVVDAGAYLVPLPGTSVTGTVLNGGTVVSSGVFIAHVFSGVEYHSAGVTNPDLGGFSITYVAPGASLSGGTLDSRIGIVFPGNGTDGTQTQYYPSTLRVEAGAQLTGLTVDSGLLVVAGSASGTIVNSGGFEVVLGTGVDSGTVLGNGGSALVSSGGAQDGASVASGGLVEVSSGAVVSGAVAQPGSLFGFVDAPSPATIGFDLTTDVLTVTGTDGNGNPFAQSITLAGDYAGDTFQTVSRPDLGLAGSLVEVESAPCYLRGTRIALESGETPVEELQEGQLVRTLSGALRPVRWIGTRAYDNRFVRNDPSVMPIAFAAGSLGEGLPRRDLLVSPEHAMFIDGVLVPAKLLVNDDTIVQASGLPVIEYFHIELESHDILLAEGAPSESFVDCDSRAMFQNAHTFAGEAPRWSFCAPRVEDGPALADIRARLRRRDTVPAGSDVRGFLDYATHEACAGWAYLPADPQATLEVEVLVDGGVIGRVTANAFRPDVRDHGFGTGRYGFELAFAQPLTRFQCHTITARAVGGGELHGAVRLEPADRLESDSLPALAAAMQARAATPDGAEELTAFLLDQLRTTRAPRRRRGSAPLALVLDAASPRPDRDAGSAAVVSHMQALQRLGYQVVFVPLDGQCGSLPPGIGRAARPAYSSVEDALRQHSDAALVYVHRCQGMTLYGALIRALCSGARLVYSVADLHFLRLGRQAALEGRAGLVTESRRLRAEELAAVRQADITLTHSIAETELLRRLVPDASIRTVLWHVPASGAPYSWRRRSGLVFAGGMAHAPNADAVRWLASEIMPRVAALDPKIRCKVVGAGWTAADRAWLHPAMDVLGPLDDIGLVYRQSRLAVAPLRFGAGVKGKVLEAFAARLPCVLTPVAMEGLALPGALRSPVAAEADAFARHVVDLHRHAAANQAAGEAGHAFVAEIASEAAVDAALSDAVASARAPRTGAGIRMRAP